jgi:secreted trypsin-like serine protease
MFIYEKEYQSHLHLSSATLSRVSLEPKALLHAMAPQATSCSGGKSQALLQGERRSFQGVFATLCGVLTLVAAMHLPLSSQQALAEPIREPKIVNGQTAAPGAWPWMVALLLTGVSDTTEAQFCGGTLIGPQHVLTAGHCVSGLAPTSIEVLIGQNTLPFTAGTRHSILGFVRHPEYNVVTLEHDLAIIKLASPVTATPIPLALQSDSSLYQPGVNAVAIGWGATDQALPIYPTDLQQAQLPIASDATCLSELGRYFKPTSMVCAGTKATSATSDDGVGACYGDSGGPLMVSDGNGGWKLYGVVSWGLGACANNQTRGVFAEVPAHESFVTSFPNVAPYFTSSPYISGVAVVGNELTCITGDLLGDPVTSVEYSWLRGEQVRGEQVIAGATSSKYTLRAEDEYSRISCLVLAKNSAGSQEAISDSVTALPAPTPTPTPTPSDVTPPVASIVAFSCTSRKCAVTVSASDSGSGIQEVSATVKFTYKAECGKRSACSQSRLKALKLNQTGNDTWKGSFRYAERKRQSAEVTVSARDTSGNRADQAAVASKRL